MKENDRMVQGDLSGLELLQSIVDGKAPMPPMAQNYPYDHYFGGAWFGYFHRNRWTTAS